MSFTIYAAVDLAGGKAVRLWQGDRTRQRVVAADAVALAGRLAAAGAEFLHLVDLDAAFGDGDNLGLVERIVRCAPCPVQVGGGIRTLARAEGLRAMGAARVVLGTAALRDPDLLARLVTGDPDGVVVAADARDGRVAVSGWTEVSGEPLGPFARRMRAAGVVRLLVTAVERDGTGAGPGLAALESALGEFGPGVIASGGVGRVEDLAALRPLVARGLAGVVVGSLLVDGRATPAGLAAAAAEYGLTADGDRPAPARRAS